MPSHPLEPLVSVEIVRVTPEKAHGQHDVVATEVPVTIVAGSVEIATLMATPEALDDLARGFLVTSGLLAPEDIGAVFVDTDLWQVTVETVRPVDAALLVRRTYSSGCGKGVVFASALEADLSALPVTWQVDASAVFALVHAFRRHSELHQATGGVHSVALARGGEVLVTCDDVGRHNALDKAVGQALRRSLPVAQTMALTTGRIAAEIVHKCRRAEIPMVVSLGATTHQAVLTARRLGVTLVAFARQGRFSIFAGPERVAGVSEDLAP
jgi:FdhD protein